MLRQICVCSCLSATDGGTSLHQWRIRDFGDIGVVLTLQDRGLPSASVPIATTLPDLKRVYITEIDFTESA